MEVQCELILLAVVFFDFFFDFCFDLSQLQERPILVLSFFVRAHMFCSSRKPWFKGARAGVDIDAINYATKFTTKIKAKLSYCNQVNFNEPVFKPVTPE